MIILGIDPGLAFTGFGVLVVVDGRPVPTAWGVIRTLRGCTMSERVAEIQRDMNDLLAAHAPDCLAVEAIFHGRNTSSVIGVTQARGAVLAAAGLRGIPCHSYTPQQAKITVTGDARAEKWEVQEGVQAELDMAILPRPNHAADALALALTHWRTVEGL